MTKDLPSCPGCGYPREECICGNIGKQMSDRMEEEVMEISRQQSKKNKEERTQSEKMQDKLEPIPFPMHEDYDDEKDNA